MTSRDKDEVVTPQVLDDHPKVVKPPSAARVMIARVSEKKSDRSTGQPPVGEPSAVKAPIEVPPPKQTIPEVAPPAQPELSSQDQLLPEVRLPLQSIPEVSSLTQPPPEIPRPNTEIPEVKVVGPTSPDGSLGDLIGPPPLVDASSRIPQPVPTDPGRIVPFYYEWPLRGPSLFGMQIEEVIEYPDSHPDCMLIKTTGAEYLLCRGGLEMRCRIDTTTNDYYENEGRPSLRVAYLYFLGDIGPLRIEERPTHICCTVYSDKLRFDFMSDSVFFVQNISSSPVSYSHNNVISNAGWKKTYNPNNNPDYGHRMWAHSTGGSLHAAVPPIFAIPGLFQDIIYDGRDVSQFVLNGMECTGGDDITYITLQPSPYRRFPRVIMPPVIPTDDPRFPTEAWINYPPDERLNSAIIGLRM